jgi:NADH pyrophosphatase NudC (nudix superfamily)
VREAKEEAGIEVKSFFMGVINKRIPEEKENSKVYGFVADKKIKLDKGELKQGMFLTIEEIEKKIKKEKFLPETKDLLKILRNNKTITEKLTKP